MLRLKEVHSTLMTYDNPKRDRNKNCRNVIDSVANRICNTIDLM